MTHLPERRRGGRCRRDPDRPAIPPGTERRQSAGCRRSLPRSRWRQWPSLLASAALGVAVAFALQALQAQATVPATRPFPPTQAQASPPPRFSPGISLAEAEALHDAARALTPTGVALDEHAHATWLPRLADLQTAAEDPRVSPEIRGELHATLEALQRVGVTRPHRGS